MGLSALDPLDARLDADGDGIDALGEFEAGTSPQDPSSVLRLRWESTQDGAVGLRAPSSAGRIYLLEQLTGSFSVPAWNVIRSVPGTGQDLDLGPLVGEEAEEGALRLRVIRDR